MPVTRTTDVGTLICEECQWVEPKTSPVIEMWTRFQSKDYCDICSARQAAEKAKAA